MLRNYFLTALRNFKNNKTYSLLNIFGLGIGLASCLFVITIIRFEYSFDNWHTNRDNIYRVVRHFNGDNGVTNFTGSLAYPTGDELVRSVPDLEKVVQLHGPTDEKIALKDALGNLQVFREKQVLYTDENFFDVLDFQIINGASGDILKEPFKMFISEKIAKKYYGELNPIGQVITMNGSDQIEIVGIVEDCPKNTNLPFEMIVSMPTLRKRMPDVFLRNWGMMWAYSNYVQIPEGADIPQIEQKIREAIVAHHDEEDRAKIDFKLQPLKEIHNDERYGDFTNYVTPSLIIWAFVLLGSLLLGTACLNFINLSTAQAIRRAKEIGIRKTLGSQKLQLIGQFLTETLVTVSAAMIIGLTLGQVMISKFNEFLKDIHYDLSYDSNVLLFGLGLVLIVTLLAGFYPSMVLSGYKPVEALSNKINIRKGSGNFGLRRILVITQFAFTNLMLITTIIIASQMNFIKSKDLGFSQKNVVMINLPSDNPASQKAFLNRFKSESYVLDAVRSYGSPMSANNWNNSFYEDGGEYQDGNNSNMKFGDDNYLEMYQIPLVHGRMYNTEIATDTSGEAVVNRKFISKLGWTEDEALGKKIHYGRRKLHIVGIMENFHTSSLQGNLEPVTLAYDASIFDEVDLLLANTPNTETIASIESIFRDFYPEDLFELTILKDQIQDWYMMESLLHQIIQFVAIITILLSSMGLYGLVSFMATKNSKTIGIRKVFGASIPNILGIFVKEYVFLLMFAFLIAAPTAWWLSGLWLDEFTFRIDITASYFIFGFLLSVIIALITVGYKSYQAATSNPIKSLRYE